MSDIFLLRFSSIEGNARALKSRAYINDSSLYFETEKNWHKAILDRVHLICANISVGAFSPAAVQQLAFGR